MPLISVPGISTSTAAPVEYTQIFHEPCEDQSWSSRGWYDGAESSGTLPLANDGAVMGSTKSIEYAFAQSATSATGASTFRKKFTPTDNLYIRFYLKLSSNWVGSQTVYHPHLIQILSTLDGDYTGFNYSYLSMLIEHNTAVAGNSVTLPRLGMVDSKNINHDSINVDLTSTTESRSVAGCNSGPLSDSEGGGDCYLQSGNYRNGWWRDGDGFPITKNQWIKYEAFFQMNSITGGIAQANGVMQCWLDGALAIDYTDVIIRTNEDYVFFNFDQGSGAEIFAGDEVTGGTSGATGTVLWVDNDNGTWGVDADGKIRLHSVTGTFQDNEALEVSATTRAQIASVPVVQNNATMQFEQFALAPYIGDGSPSVADQTMWIDDIVLGSATPTDTLAPVLSNETAIKTSSTTGQGQVDTANDSNGALYWIVTEASNTPSSAQVRVLTDFNDAAGVDSGAVGVTAEGTQSPFNFTGLTANTTYYAFYMHEDAFGNQSTVAAPNSFTTDAAADVTAPVLSAASAVSQTSISMNGVVTSANDANGTLYGWASTSGSAPTPGTVKTNAAGAQGNSQTVTATGQQPQMVFNNLTASTTYYLYFMHEDAAGNQSNVPTITGQATNASGSVDGIFTDGVYIQDFNFGQSCVGAGAGTLCSSLETVWEFTRGADLGVEVCLPAASRTADGGNGCRLVIGDGPNAGPSPKPRFNFTERRSEFWMRWYMRYESGFNWGGGNPNYTKPIYCFSHGPGSGGIWIIPQPDGNGWQVTGSQGNSVYQLPGYTKTFSDVFNGGGAESDGSWHCFELYVKMNSAVDVADGKVAFWIDEEPAVKDFSHAFVIASVSKQSEALQGFDRFQIHENQKTPDNANGSLARSTAYVDYDDFKISIVTPSGTDIDGDPFIGF